MGKTIKGHGGLSSSKHGTAFDSHRNKGHLSPSSDEGKSSEFPAFPKSATSSRSGGNSGVSTSNVRPGVVYIDDKPADSTLSNEKPSDSSFFDATRSSGNDDSGFKSVKPDSRDKPSFDSDSFFDEAKSSKDDRSEFESVKPNSRDKPTFDSDSFFDAAKSSEDDRSEFEPVKPDSKDKTTFDSDSFFDEAKSSEDDRSEFERVKPDSRDKPTFDSDQFFDEAKSSEDDRSEFERVKPDSKDKPSFNSDKYTESRGPGLEFEKSSHSDDQSTGSSSRFHNERVDVENQKREFSGRSGVKPPFPGTSKFPLSSDKPFLAGTPKIRFVMGSQASGRFSARGPLRKRVFRDGPTTFHSPYTLRDRVFYLSGAGDVPAYDFSSVYGPSASLLYDGGDAPLFLDGAGLEEDVFVDGKK